MKYDRLNSEEKKIADDLLDTVGSIAEAQVSLREVGKIYRAMSAAVEIMRETEREAFSDE